MNRDEKEQIIQSLVSTLSTYSSFYLADIGSLNSEKTSLNRAHSDHDAAKRQFAHAQSASSQAERAYQSLMQEKIALDQQRNQQHRANRYGSYGRGGYGRRHYGVGPLGGALRIIPSPTIIVH